MDGRDERRGFGIRARVREQALEAAFGLELAHVEPHQPIRRAEQELCERLRDLRLARPCGADEEKDTERAAGVRQVRLDECDPVDEAVDGIRLAEDTRREEAAYLVEIERRFRVDDMERKPGRLRERLDDVLAANLRATVSGRTGDRGLQQAQEAGWSGDPGEIVLREILCVVDRRVVDVRAG